MIHRIEVATRSPDFPDLEGVGVLREVQELGISSVTHVRCVKIYKLEGAVSKSDLKRIIDEVLVEALWQDHAVDKPVLAIPGTKIVEIARKPGVMDTETDSLLKAMRDLGVTKVKLAGTGKKFLFTGSKISDAEIRLITSKVLMNALIDRVINTPEKTLHVGSTRPKTKFVRIRTMSDAELESLSHQKLWLSLDEMRAVRDHFITLKRDPTDIEIEIFAQTWSEHCGHKTFNAALVIDGKKKRSLMSRLKQTTKKVNKPWCLSVFKDNAGVIEFDETYGICGKVETHNSPSAIEPYGGAMTGSGGVFRDIMGCGRGAKVIASTDMFCVAPPHIDEGEVPAGCIHPKRLLKEVVRGVKDYGNRMGIPTNNGSVHFHHDFRAKPSIIVGSYGLIPKKYVSKKKLRTGDRILSVGGKTGRDGIHGVTFSSASMTDATETVSSSAVQIGNAIEQKRMFDAILKCRDLNLLRSIQDCGGGGYSSAIGELARETGADIHLDTIPQKYPGLASWELWISESQERMVLVVSESDVQKVKEICAHHNVCATEVGRITDTKRLRLFYDKTCECDLSTTFLFEGCPTVKKIGKYQPSAFTEPSIKEPKQYEKILKKLLSSGDICSKEPIVRLYDHEVQGTSVLKPFAGKDMDVPQDASVIAPILGSMKGMAVGHGMSPLQNRIDPYWGAASAIDEAVRNLVAVGVDPTKIALIDNFIWPTPDEGEIARLDRSVEACVDTATAFGMPFVSGKDSLSSTYTASTGEVIKIPPTLCISAFAPIRDIRKTISSDFKSAGNPLYLLGMTYRELGASSYYQLFKKVGNSVPKHDAKTAIRTFKKLHMAIQSACVVSAHDLSEGGLAVALTEMSFGIFGASIDIALVPRPEPMREDEILFAESNSRLLVEVQKGKESQFQKTMKGVVFAKIGEVQKKPQLTVRSKKKTLINASIGSLKTAWKKPMKQLFS